MGEGVGCGVGARGQVGELGHSLLGHGQKTMRRKASRAVRKRNSGNEGKFVRNSYEIRTSTYEIPAQSLWKPTIGMSSGSMK